MRKLIAVVAGAVLLLVMAHPAFAHPHIFVNARAALVFDAAGDLTAIRNQWTFDPAFSAWAIQGLDKNNDGVISEAELQPLADDYMKGLAAYGFYTSAGESGRPDLAFHALPGPHIDYADQRLTLRFAVAPDQPYRLEKTLEIGIDDPEYYVAITFAGPPAIRLENAPPGCQAVLNPPKPMSYDLETRLAAIGADVVKLPPTLEATMRGVQGSIDLSCDYAVTGPKQNPMAAPVTADNASTAVDAVNAMAATAAGTPRTGIGGKPIPFGGPPRELGGFLPNSGIFLWILTQQQKFYELLTGTMGQLKANGAAFWLLGLLSFLYGIFHAAGPGHGKVVISSYVLANERQYRQGMLLSFASAMVGSAVAVVFILFAASVLRLTGTVMGNVAAWLDNGSYAMVSLLGLWLLIRQIFGLGHHHHRAEGEAIRQHDDHADHRRAHRLLFEDGARTPTHAASSDPAGRDAGHVHRGVAPAPSLLARAFETSASGHGAPGPAYAYAAATPGSRYGLDAAADHGDVRPHPHDHDHHHGHGEAHSHVAVVPAQLRNGGWREALGIVLAVGLRPCSGALIVMVFALSQGVLWAGIAAVFLMGVGTAITVATLATLAMFAKGLARRLSSRRQTVALHLVWWAELGGALFVFVFGIVLILANLYG